MTAFYSIILAFRPKTLTAALVPCLAGTALAFNDFHHWNFKVLLYSLLSSFCIQIGTNLVNDALDFKKGADTEKRIGPQRITQAGILTARQVLFLAFLFFTGALLFGIPLVSIGGVPIVVIGIISLMLGYAYTGGPYPLAYKGLGDLFVILFFGIVAVQGIYYLHTGFISIASFVLGLQIGLLAAVLIAINNLRDIETDHRVNKKTLAVRLGVELAKKEIEVLCLLPFILNFYWLWKQNYLAFFLPWMCFPVALKLINKIKNTPPSPIYNQFLGLSAGLHMLFGLFMSVGLFWCI